MRIAVEASGAAARTVPRSVGADLAMRPDERLVALVRSQAPLRRALAALAGRLVAKRAWERLGFARLADYAREVRAIDRGSLEAAALERDEDGAAAWPRTGVRIRCTPEVQAKWWRVRTVAQRVAGEKLPPWGCMEAVVAEVLSTLPLDASATAARMFDHALEAWGANEPHVRREQRIFARDGWRCTAPGCSSRRNLHDHHVVFRSLGGSDDPELRTRGGATRVSAPRAASRRARSERPSRRAGRARGRGGSRRAASTSRRRG
jgi:hypothetical protein